MDPFLQDHILVVSLDPEHLGELLVEVECPGVTDRCQAWAGCPRQYCDVDDMMSNRLALIAHDVEHRLIADRWMIPTGECYVATHDRLGGAVPVLPPGRYAISWSVGDGTELDVHREHYVVPDCGHVFRECWSARVRRRPEPPRVCRQCRPDHPYAVGESPDGFAMMPVRYYDEPLVAARTG